MLIEWLQVMEALNVLKFKPTIDSCMWYYKNSQNFMMYPLNAQLMIING